MWQTLRHSTEMDPLLVDTSVDLLRSTSRALSYVIGAAALGAFLCTAVWPEQIGSQVIVLTPLLLLICWVSIKLLPKSILMANAILIVGLAAATTGAAYLFQMREIAYGLVILPFIAMVTVGWPLAIGAHLVIAASLLALGAGHLTEPVYQGQGIAILMASAFVTFMAGTSSRTILTVSQWSVASYQQALANLNELRERRAELARLVRELDRTSRSLERTNHVLVLARAAAEEARDARNRLALSVSHELRTPLNFVIGFSELMVSSPETYAPVTEWPEGLYDDVQEIYNSSSHLLGLVNDVIDLGQMESLQTVLFKDWVDPQQILYEVETMVQPAFARKGLWLRIHGDGGLPQVYVDRVRIRQVLLNLITNSLRFTNQGGVTVHATTEDEMLKITVTDTGSGISEEDLPHIFEPFRSSNPQSWRQHEGAGLGLSISHRLIELHGGTIWVEHSSNTGTLFCFTLPTAEAARAQARRSRNADESYWHWREQRAEREALALAYSPHPDTARVLAAHLGDLKVMATQDLARVPQLVQELYPRAVLLDQDHVTAEDLMRLQEDLPYDLPVVAFPFPGRPNRQQILHQGVVAQFVKPIDRRELAQTLQNLELTQARLLVVDDDQAMASFVRRIVDSPAAGLGDTIAETVAASDGAQALAEIDHCHPDVAILDIHLPDMTGWDLLERIAPLRIPVILMTGHENEFATSDRDRYALQLLMTRPLARTELDSVLSGVLSSVTPRYPSLQGLQASSEEPAE